MAHKQLDCKEFGGLFSRVSDDYCQGIQKSSSGEEKGSLPRVFVDQLRDASRESWYPTLRSIRETRQILGTHDIYGIVSSAWGRLGEVLGLDETAECSRFELMLMRGCLCWWRSCMYNQTPSPKPLLTCKGCKEARYCSALCQKRLAHSIAAKASRC